MTTATKRLPGRPPDEALQERRRSQILQEAIVVFAKHGYRATDVSWIAEPLGISKATIYHYFKSKKELFLAAVRQGVDQMQQFIREARQGIEDPFEMMSQSVRAYLRFFQEHADLVELFIQERAEFRGKHTPVYFENRDMRREHWNRWLTSLIDDGKIRRIPVDRMMDVIGNLLYGTMFATHMAQKGRDFASQTRDILEVLFFGLLTDSERRQPPKCFENLNRGSKPCLPKQP